MRKEGARLFKKFGELRDTQVMIEWMKIPGAPQDDAARILQEQLVARESELKEAAAASLSGFDKKQWAAWAARLVKRAARIPPRRVRSSVIWPWNAGMRHTGCTGRHSGIEATSVSIGCASA